MKGKKFLAAALSACVLAGSLAACNNGGSTDSGSGNTSGKVKLTALFVKHPLTKDVTKMKWLTELEEKAGVDVEWQQISADWGQKKSAMFASGEIPDLLFNAVDGGGSDFAQYNGLFADLTELIEKDAPNLQEMFKDHPEAKTLVTIDGKIYATPKYQAVWPKTNATTFINKTWLDNLGLQVPTTWDELEQVLIAFKQKDANKNGNPSDEIPMDFNGFDGAYGPKNLLGSTGMQVTGIGTGGGYFAEDGKIKNFYTDERFKSVEKFLQKLFKQGLINQEVVTQDYSKFQSVARGSGKTAAVGFTWGWEAGDRFGVDLKDQYIPVPQLKEKADTPKVCYSYDFYDLNYAANSVSMSNKCGNKDAAMKFIDAFYDEKNSIQVLFGGMNDTDKGVKDNGDGTYEVLPPADSAIDPGTWKWTNSFADNGPIYIRDEMKTKLKLGTDMQAVTKEKAAYDDLLKAVDPKKNVYPQSFMKYSQEDINTLSMNQANIGNIADQTWSTWMTDSSKNIDAEWDTFVQSLKGAGLSQNLEIRQKAYDEYLKTVK